MCYLTGNITPWLRVNPENSIFLPWKPLETPFGLADVFEMFIGEPTGRKRIT